MTVGIGSVVAGRYRIDELVGRGGMADVYRAHDERLGRDVALKVLRAHTASDTDRIRFEAEARTLAQLDHPSIVALVDAGLDEDQPWLAMQLIDGATLATRFAGGPLWFDDVAAVGHQVALGLACAHERGIVHRDVKPGNVLLTPDGRALLADFGIAHLLDSATRHTAVGQAIGSPAYLAPEQASGGELSGATDVYSLGLLLLESITGRRPFEGTTTEVVYARLHRQPEIGDDVPPGWAALLRRMTAVTPADRPSAAEVATALAAYDGVDLPTDPEATAPFVLADATRVMASPMAAAAAVGRAEAAADEAVPTHRRRPLWVAAALVPLAFLVGLALWLSQGNNPAPATEPDRPTESVSPTRTLAASPTPTPVAVTKAPVVRKPAPAPAPAKHGKAKGKGGKKHKK